MNNLFEQSKASGKPYWDLYYEWLLEAAKRIKFKYGVTLLYTTERTGFPGIDLLTGLSWYESYTAHSFQYPGVQYEIPSDRLIVVTAGDAGDAGERLLMSLAIKAEQPMPPPLPAPVEPAPGVGPINPIGFAVGGSFPGHYYVERSSPDAGHSEVTVDGKHYVAVFIGGFAGPLKLWKEA